jgi:hypothetical protein
MVHHSIAVVFTSFLTNFVEFYKSEVQLRRIPIPRTSVNRKAPPSSPKAGGAGRKAHPEYYARARKSAMSTKTPRPTRADTHNYA